MALEGPEWLGHTLCNLALLLMELAAEPSGEQDQMLNLPQMCVCLGDKLGKGAVLTGESMKQ